MARGSATVRCATTTTASSRSPARYRASCPRSAAAAGRPFLTSIPIRPARKSIRQLCLVDERDVRARQRLRNRLMQLHFLRLRRDPQAGERLGHPIESLLQFAQ